MYMNFRSLLMMSVLIVGLNAILMTTPVVAAEDTSPGDWLQGCSQHPELCVPRCQRDPQFCAQQVVDYLLDPLNNRYRFQNWPLFPGVSAMHANTSTPMHGAYLSIFLNQPANSYVNQVLGDFSAVDMVDFPNGSLVVKQNFTTSAGDPGQPPWLTVMWKLDGYCHADFGGSGPCVGGEWFWFLYRFGEFLQFNKVPAVGKAQAFCTDCHGPVQKGDFVWRMFDSLKAKLPATSTVPSEQAATKNVVSFCENTPITATVPGDVAFKPMDIMKKDGAAKTQLMFDCLSWTSFLAMNWPAEAGQRGVPDTKKNLADGGERVWESYREVFEIFQPANPNWTLDNVSWNDPEHFDPVCKQEPGDKVLRMSAKQRNSQILNETHQAFGNQFNILVDQNSNQLMFEVRMNRDEFEYFKNNDFANTGNYDVGGPLQQLSWKAPPLHFPDNIRGVEGAIEIKAAWREMCTDAASCNKVDDPSRYYVRDAVFYEADPAGGEASCKSVQVGLVGFHIGHKTFWSPQWVWSTFEHIENVPPAGKESEARMTADGKTPYSLYSPELAKKQPPVDVCNKQRPGAIPNTSYPWYNPDSDTCPNLQLIANSHPGPVGQTDESSPSQNDDKLTPNQVTRLDAITSSPLNAAYRDKLKAMNSPFQYYQLVNTQWPMKGRGNPVETTINMNQCANGETEDCFVLKPDGLRLRNTTMETYQVTYDTPTNHPSGQTSSVGCMECHGGAGLDFSFAWTDASEEIVPVVQDDLSTPPRGTYQQSCFNIMMSGTSLDAQCSDRSGFGHQSRLENAHLCTGDIANINGKLMCNPPVGNFSLSCNMIDVENNQLTAQCLKADNNTRVAASLNVSGYHGVISNCNGVLTKGRCT